MIDCPNKDKEQRVYLRLRKMAMNIDDSLRLA